MGKLGDTDVETLPIAGEAMPVYLRDVAFNYAGAHGDAGVLSGASLLLEPGELAVITGENGAGKSTLLKLVLGELAPTAGMVRLFGRDPVRFHDWGRVGYVPQRTVAAYGQFPASVEEVVRANLYTRHPRLRLSMRGLLEGGRSERARASEALAAVGLAGCGDRMLGELSGGQLQRVLLARALIAGPSLLVMDEPTSGLDADAASAFCALIARLRSRDPKLSVLMVTHDLQRLHRLSGSVYRLEAGRLAACGTLPAAPDPAGGAPAKPGSGCDPAPRDVPGARGGSREEAARA